MMPSLGGGSSLRGYASWRFRDMNSLLLQAEWRVLVNSFFDMARVLRRGQGRGARAGPRLERAEERRRPRLPRCTVRPPPRCASSWPRATRASPSSSRPARRSEEADHDPSHYVFAASSVSCSSPSWSAAALAATAASVRTASKKFYSDDPIAREPESADASKAAPWDIDLFYDLTYQLFVTPGKDYARPRAQNVNTIDEVPDSSWFTNRVGARPHHRRGGDEGPRRTAPRRTRPRGPSRGRRAPAPRRASPPRTRTAGTWFVSFDAPVNPEGATGALVVATKLFWALGYNQVEYHLTTLRPDKVQIDPQATRKRPSGDRTPLTEGDVHEILERANRNADGTLPHGGRPHAARQGARRLQVPGHPAGRPQRHRAARAPSRAAGAAGVRRVGEPHRHEGGQHARHRHRPRAAAASCSTTCRTSARRSVSAPTGRTTGTRAGSTSTTAPPRRSGSSRSASRMSPWQTYDYEKLPGHRPLRGRRVRPRDVEAARADGRLLRDARR